MSVARIDETRPGAPGRVPPHNLQAEESLLGAMLLSRDAIAAAVEVVSADDFYRPSHGHVFEAICSLYSAGEPADPVTVAEELSRAGLLDAIGGPATLISLQAHTPATSSAAKYARIVEELALLRRLIGVANDVAEIAYDVPEDVTTAVDRAEAMVYEVAQRRVTDTMAPLRDLLSANLDRLEQLYERGEAITGIPSGYHDLDEILSGLQPNALFIVGARPSMGKCVRWDTLVVDPTTGERRTAAELHALGQAGAPAAVAALDDGQRLAVRTPSAFIDDGVKPVWRVRTRLGREVSTTWTHPFLTPAGWRPLGELAVGDRVAVPRTVPFFGDDRRKEEEVKLLAYLLGDGDVTQSSPRFTNTDPVIIEDVRACAAAFGAHLSSAGTGSGTAPTFRIVTPRGQANPVLDLLREHGLLGCPAAAKRVPEAIFRLPADQVALFLNRLFATDGSAWWTDAGSGYGRVSYASVSEGLVRDVQHLLLRFGLNARRRRRWIAYRGTRRRAFELELMTADDIVGFARHIGIHGKEVALAHLVEQMEGRRRGATRDTLPVEIWHRVLQAKGSRSWAEVSEAAGKPRSHNWHVHRRAPRRETVAALAEALACEELATWARSDIYWDEIVEITYEGEHQVYDLTVPGDHNFVADDVFVHNTAFALGAAAHAAIEAHRPVLFFSLEMSQLELTQRILCSEARVDSRRVRNGRLAEADWQKISHAVGRLAEAPMYIDDNPHLTVMEIRAKARRLKSRLGDLGLVVVDYLQLMTGRSGAESRQVEVSEISRGLKILARELEAPVMALSQLSRQLEMRQDKRPILADLRESGCLTADTVVVRADNGRQVTMGQLLRDGARDIPVWTLDEHYRLVPGVMSHVFPSGTKPVYRLTLASGRSVKASANHPFLALEGWYPLERFDVGDRIAIPRAGSWPPAVGDVVTGPDTVPRELWTYIRKALGNWGLTLKDLEERLGVEDFVGSVYATELSRSMLGRIAEVVPDQFLSDLADSDVHWDTIVSIEELGPQPVFDATVAGTHNFVADGIVVHNSIEQDADVVMFIYRDEVYNAESPDRGTAEILVSKHRNGPTGMARLAFLDHYTRFANMAKGV